MYNPAEIDDMLGRLEILIDTREQDTPLFKRRTEGFKCPFVRYKLDYGDYSCRTFDNAGNEVSLKNRAVIERKMNWDELCSCFGHGRARFQREFERAYAAGCVMYLLIENADFEKLYAHKYRSKLTPQSLIASIFSWSARYNMKILFCKAETSGALIHDILKYEMREYLLNCEEKCNAGAERIC